MKKQRISGWGLVLIGCLSSCYSNLHLTQQPEFMEYSGQKGVWVMKVETKKGDSVIYSRKFPGVLNDTAVITCSERLVTISKSQVDSVRQNFNETRTSHFWLNGKKYAIKDDAGSTFSYLVQDTLYLPFNEIAEVDAIKFQKTQRTLAIVFGSLSGAALLIVLISALLDDFTLFEGI